MVDVETRVVTPMLHFMEYIGRPIWSSQGEIYFQSEGRDLPMTVWAIPTEWAQRD